MERDHLRTSEELVERSPEKIKSFIAYQRTNHAGNTYQKNQVLYAAYDTNINSPIMISANASVSKGAILRVLGDIDALTSEASISENIEPTTFVKQLVALQVALQSKTVTNIHSFRVGNVYMSRMYWGYVFWKCPWTYWNTRWPSAALFAAMDCMIRFVSNIIFYNLFYNYIFSFPYDYIFTILPFYFLGLDY